MFLSCLDTTITGGCIIILCVLVVIVILTEKVREGYSSPNKFHTDVNKKLKEQVKQVSLKTEKLQKENEHLQKEIQELHQKTNFNFEYCRLQSDDNCGSCVCRDDERLSKIISLRLSKLKT